MAVPHQLLTREQLLAHHMRRYGVPAPAAFAVHLGPDDFLVSAEVDDDGGAEPAAALGALMRRIHEVPVSAEIDDAIGVADLPATLAARIAGRLRAVQQRSGAALPDVPAAALRDRLAGARLRSSVLHMDIRRANLRVAGGEIRAIVGWSNALIGDPALELACAAELGMRSPAFDAGYGALPRRPAELDALYRLDTAARLAVAALSAAPDPGAVRRQVARVEQLVALLGPL